MKLQNLRGYPPPGRADYSLSPGQGAAVAAINRALRRAGIGILQFCF